MTDHMSTTEVCRAAGFQLSSGIIKACGVSPVFVHSNAILWDRKDLPRILAGVAKLMIDRAAKLIDEEARA